MLPMLVGETRTATAVFTHAGQPARVTGVPAWTSTNPAVMTVTPSENGMTAVVTAVAPGDAQVTMTAQAGEVTLAAPAVDIHVELPLADAAAIVLA